ncbi:hypothetical protein XENTR_v10014521 [Xenopus tropicalis]|nr:hypothetical protein XENTR_v10014521 [Xenopus tropicalis]
MVLWCHGFPYTVFKTCFFFVTKMWPRIHHLCNKFKHSKKITCRDSKAFGAILPWCFCKVPALHGLLHLDASLPQAYMCLCQHLA